MCQVKYIGFLKEATRHQFIGSAKEEGNEVSDRQSGGCTFLEPTGSYHSPSPCVTNYLNGFSQLGGC